MNDEAQVTQKLRDIADTWTGAPDMRVCAVCLCEVPRESYNEHIQLAHGYKLLMVAVVPTNV